MNFEGLRDFKLISFGFIFCVLKVLMMMDCFRFPGASDSASNEWIFRKTIYSFSFLPF